MKKNTSMRLSDQEKESVNEALKLLELKISQYFIKLHYSFWDSELLKLMRSRKEEPATTSLIALLKKKGVLEDGEIH